MSTAKQAEAAHKAFDLETEVSIRLMAVIDDMPQRQRRRFRSAARRAAKELEAHAPAIIGMTPRGMLAGLYSEVVPGRFVVVIASANDCFSVTPPFAYVDEAIADAQASMDAMAEAWGSVSGALPALLAAVLEARALTGAGLGFLLHAPEHREMIRIFAESGVTPALVALLSKDRTGSVRVVLPHGRIWPTLELDDPHGHA